MRPTLSLLAVLLALVSSVAGQLEFERSQVAAHAQVGDAAITVSYPFKNIGSIPVSILRTEASCDCTTAKLTKSTYGPGESGEVAVTFRFGDREGEQSKMVTVYTDEPAMAGYRLLLHVEIPVAATVAPRLLFWRERGPYEPKMVTIANKTDGRLKLASVDEPSGAFQLQSRPLDDGRGYSLSVVPLNPTKNCAVN